MRIHHKGEYSAKRREAYPAVEEQLDMLWHAMNAEEVARVEPFYTSIKKVKEMYPKS